VRDPRPRQAEAACACAASPRRCEPDRFEPAPIADEGIPGRLKFDVYLLRSNRQQRVAEWMDEQVRGHPDSGARGCDDPSRVQKSQRGERPQDASPRDGPEASGAPKGAPGLARPTARVALVVVASTRRGSIIDVLA
jgi:hypothetical protein